MNENIKKLLCKNILKNGECGYGKNCLYAHGYGDQKIDEVRNRSYKLILGKMDLCEYDLTKNMDVFNDIICLTNVCKKCVKNTCPGGLNCKNGAVSEKYCVCKRDILNSDCDDDECEKIHLTKRNLISYNKMRAMNRKLEMDIIGIDDESESFDENFLKTVKNYIDSADNSSDNYDELLFN